MALAELLAGGNEMKSILTREDRSADGTFGRMTVGGLTLFSGELPWADNAPDRSCIPVGEYRCAFTFSPRFRRMLYLVIDVPGRSGIRFHAANLMGAVDQGRKSQLNGCIALGERIGFMDGQKALLLSAPALRRFESALGGGPFDLEVRDEHP